MPENASPDHYDLIVIGCGQGADPLACEYVSRGKRAAIIERDHVGGSCVNYGCTPTKLLAGTAQTAWQASRAQSLGVQASCEGVDWPKIKARKEALVEDFRQGTKKKLEKCGVDIIWGEGRFVGPQEVAVKTSEGERRLTAETIVIDTGTMANIPEIPGFADVPCLDNERILQIDELPEHLIIIGGGYISAEYAQTFRRFGSEVTILEKGSTLLKQSDPDVSECVQKLLEDEGITVRLGVEIERAEKGPKLILKGGDEIAGSHVLVAAGRKPNSDCIDPKAGGIELDERGYVKVNDRLQTSNVHVYSIGDVKGGPAFTHVSYDDYRVLKTNLLDGGDRSIADRQIPWCVYTDPQIAHFGLNETQAKEKGIEHRICKIEASDIARAVETEEAKGFLKAVVGKDDQILGITAVLTEGGEVMTMVQLAMMGKLTATDLYESILTHPTWGESLNNLFAPPKG